MIIGMSPPRFIKRFSYFLLSIFYFFIFFAKDPRPTKMDHLEDFLFLL